MKVLKMEWDAFKLLFENGKITLCELKNKIGEDKISPPIYIGSTSRTSSYYYVIKHQKKFILLVDGTQNENEFNPTFHWEKVRYVDQQDVRDLELAKTFYQQTIQQIHSEPFIARSYEELRKEHKYAGNDPFTIETLRTQYGKNAVIHLPYISDTHRTHILIYLQEQKQIMPFFMPLEWVKRNYPMHENDGNMTPMFWFLRKGKREDARYLQEAKRVFSRQISVLDDVLTCIPN